VPHSRCARAAYGGVHAALDFDEAAEESQTATSVWPASLCETTPAERAEISGAGSKWGSVLRPFSGCSAAQAGQNSGKLKFFLQSAKAAKALNLHGSSSIRRFFFVEIMEM